MRGHMKCLYVPSYSKFSIIFLSLTFAWMFGPIYTGTGGCLFGERRKFVEMFGMVFLFIRCER